MVYMKAEKNEYVMSGQILFGLSLTVWLGGISDREGSCAVNFFSYQPALNYGFYKPDPAKKWPMDAPGPKATLKNLKILCAFGSEWAVTVSA
jgi:maltose alpha-D-glucosyltransferase/alpha-amylase